MRFSHGIVLIAFTAAFSAPITLTAANANGIATADGEESGVTVVVQELKRGSADTVTLKFTIINKSAKSFGFGYAMGDPKHHIPDFDSVGGVQLIDEAGKKKYFVVRDTQKKCVCSQNVKDIEKGGSRNLWAKFPAPPAKVQKISVVIPHFGPMDDVPISH